jgi:hypothetical protein
MDATDDLFNLSSSITATFTTAGSSIPVIIIDNVYARPDEIREMALSLPFSSPSYPYPGKLAIPPATKGLQRVTEWALRMANESYLPRIPPIAKDNQQITAFREVYTDFAVIDVHPHELSETQRLPHVDPVPVFGLIYLNREERGGTLFFDKAVDAARASLAAGYLTKSNGEFELRGQIEAAFNRMAIYPGFVPHSGEIEGDWIEDERRFTSPRLTQRFAFLP